MQSVYGVVYRHEQRRGIYNDFGTTDRKRVRDEDEYRTYWAMDLTNEFSSRTR